MREWGKYTHLVGKILGLAETRHPGSVNLFKILILDTYHKNICKYDLKKSFGVLLGATKVGKVETFFGEAKTFLIRHIRLLIIFLFLKKVQIQIDETFLNPITYGRWAGGL